MNIDCFKPLNRFYFILGHGGTRGHRFFNNIIFKKSVTPCKYCIYDLKNKNYFQQVMYLKLVIYLT